MQPSPTKSVRFEKDKAPLKGVLKKFEVVIPVWVKHHIYKFHFVFDTSSTANLFHLIQPVVAGTMMMMMYFLSAYNYSFIKSICNRCCRFNPSTQGRRVSTSNEKSKQLEHDDDEHDLWSAFEDDTTVTPKKGYSFINMLHFVDPTFYFQIF